MTKTPETQYHGVLCKYRILVDRDNLRAELAASRNEIRELAAYAMTVRVDRRDETGEFALQTVDWCEGLMENASAALATTEGGQA